MQFSPEASLALGAGRAEAEEQWCTRKHFSAASSNDPEIVPAPEKISLARKSPAFIARGIRQGGGGGIISSEKLLYLF